MAVFPQRIAAHRNDPGCPEVAPTVIPGTNWVFSRLKNGGKGKNPIIPVADFFLSFHNSGENQKLTKNGTNHAQSINNLLTTCPFLARGATLLNLDGDLQYFKSKKQSFLQKKITFSLDFFDVCFSFFFASSPPSIVIARHSQGYRFFSRKTALIVCLLFINLSF